MGEDVFVRSRQSVFVAFSFTLACFLTGIAVGAYFGKRICRSRFVDIPFIGQASCGRVLPSFDFGCCVVVDGFFLASAPLRRDLHYPVCRRQRLIFPAYTMWGDGWQQIRTTVSMFISANVAAVHWVRSFIGFGDTDFLSTHQIYLLICLISPSLCFVHCLHKKSPTECRFGSSFPNVWHPHVPTADFVFQILLTVR